MQDQNHELVSHFSQPGYGRFLTEVLKKWESYGRVGGQSIRLIDPTEEECLRIGGLMGEYFEPGAPLTVKMNRVEQQLQSSKWSIGVEALLTVLQGRPLLSKQEQRVGRFSDWEAFCSVGIETCKRPETGRWMSGLLHGTALGYRTVKVAFDEDREYAISLMLTCIRALDELPNWKGETERIPVFANRLFGNPHVLDADKPEGRLFYHSLCDVMGVDSENHSEWKRDVLVSAGLLPDDLFSQVTVVGVEADKSDPWHLFFHQAKSVCMPMVLPLNFLQQSVKWRSTKRLYVVENPAVFQTILDRWPQNRPIPPLVCTSGQLSVAAWRLLDSFAESGTQIWYGGDFDKSGIDIVLGLYKRFGDRVRAWRMGSLDYLSCEKGINMEPAESKSIAEMLVPWDTRLGTVISERKLKVFQESLLELLLKDLLTFE